MIRYRWLNALIIGATLMVWLSLIGGLVGAAALVALAASSSSSSEPTIERVYVNDSGEVCEQFTDDRVVCE